MESERLHMLELRRLEEDISRQRITALAAMETAAEEEMEVMDRLVLAH
jgi:hypothetical protein